MNSKILPAIALMLATGIFFAYVSPEWNGPIAATKASIAADERALVASKQYVARQNQLATARDAISIEDQKALAAFLPSSVDNVGLIMDLNALAARSGLSIGSINVTEVPSTNENSYDGNAESLPGDDVNPIGSVDLSLSATGTFSALQTFLSDAEKSRRLMDVHDLTVNGSDTGVYEYKMTFSIYWLR